MITGLIKLHHAFHFEPLIRIDEDRTPCRFSITKVLYKSKIYAINLAKAEPRSAFAGEMHMTDVRP